MLTVDAGHAQWTQADIEGTLCVSHVTPDHTCAIVLTWITQTHILCRSKKEHVMLQHLQGKLHNTVPSFWGNKYRLQYRNERIGATFVMLTVLSQ